MANKVGRFQGSIWGIRASVPKYLIPSPLIFQEIARGSKEIKVATLRRMNDPTPSSFQSVSELV